MPEPTAEEIAAAETAKAEQEAKAKSDADAKAKADAEAKAKVLTITQESFDAAIADRLKRQEAQFKKQSDDDKAKAEQAKLAEQGKWQLIAEQKDAELTALRAEVESAKLDTLRATVGAKHKLPEILIPLIQGATETEMDKHAKDLAATVAPPRPPAPEGGPARPAAGSYTPEKARQDLHSRGTYSGM